MSDFRIKNLVLGIFQTNCYVIDNRAINEAIVIDPADNADAIEQYLKANDLVCKGILLTHGHFDHIMAARELADRTKALIFAHEAEAALLGDSKLNASSLIRKECSLVPDRLLKDQETLQLAGFTINVIHTPGHTAGGACYYVHGYATLISGDTLFRGSIGRTDFPTGNGKALVRSILDKLMLLEDETKVYPGHGLPTTIGYERDNNIYLTHDPDAFEF